MLIGHQKQWQFLKKSAELGKLSHAYLFSGPEKVGKKTLAWQLVKLLFDDENIQKRPHPDLILVEPEEKDSNLSTPSGRGHPKKEIKISQIRELILKLGLKPSLAPLKVGIIDQAHSMNQEAQNCFLKTLEEPRGQTLLILITEHPEFLFPTIRSRTEIIKFYPVAKKEIENYLREQGFAELRSPRLQPRREINEIQRTSHALCSARAIEEKKVQLISQISQGRPGVAMEFLNQSEKLKEREGLINEIIKLTKADLVSRFQYAKKISPSPQLKEILNLWLFHFREDLISNLNSKESIWRVGKLAKILEKIQETLFLISFTNVNPKLALEILMLELPSQVPAQKKVKISNCL